MKIDIQTDMSSQRFQKLCDLWDQNDSAYVSLKAHSSNDLETILQIALESPNRELAKVVMEAVGEHPLTSSETLRLILKQSDVAARESVCMRTDLSADLKAECMRFDLVHKKMGDVGPGSH